MESVYSRYTAPPLIDLRLGKYPSLILKIGQFIHAIPVPVSAY
jgi:hypothetical protein